MLVTGPDAKAASDAVELFTPQDPALKEISGVTPDPGGSAYWVNQDALKPSEVTLLGDVGQTLATVTPVGTTFVDAEDLVRLRSGRLLVADTGDASLVTTAPQPRTEYQLVRFPVPRASQTVPGTQDSTPAEVLSFEYPDSAAYNVEAIAVDEVERVVYLFQKAPPKQTTARVWRLELAGFDGEIQQAQEIARLEISGISSAVMGPGRQYLALRDGARALLYPLSGGNVVAALAQKPTVVRLPAQPQGEALTITADGHSIVAVSEGRQPFWLVPLPEPFASAQPVPAVQEQAEKGPPRVTLVLAVAAVTGVLGVAVVGRGLWRNSQRRSAALSEE